MSERPSFLIRADSWFDTRQKRFAWIALAGYIWLIWQTLWTLLISVRLCFLSGSDSLFSLMAQLKQFEPALIERLILNLSAQGTLSLAAVCRALFAALNWSDWAGLFCLFLTFFIPAQRRSIRFLGMLGALMAGLILIIVLAFGAGNLYAVSVLLKWMGFIFTGISLVQGAILSRSIAKTALLLV